MKKQYICPITESTEIHAMVTLLAGSSHLKASGSVFTGEVKSGNAGGAL